jgi:hydrogenase maturation protein HypF
LKSKPLLAVGGHLKSSVALSIGEQAVVSQHLGDLDNEPSMEAFEEAIDMLQQIYSVDPSKVVCDLHPDYVSTRFAESSGKPVIKVQHHHAHVASCMLEHQLAGPVCGLAWDGTGYGLDGTIWGGECLRATYDAFERVGHLRTFALPGGDQAAREPRRSALGLLYELFSEEACAQLPAFSASEQTILLKMLAQQIHTTRTSSMGRFFDVIAAILGIGQISTYEGQAAMQVEFAADGCSHENDRGYSMPDGDWEPLIRAVLDDRQKVSRAIIAYSVHAALARCAVTWAERTGLSDVVLTGGCFQNALLLELTHAHLIRNGRTVYFQQHIPPNDGGLSLGQLAVAAALDND